MEDKVPWVAVCLLQDKDNHSESDKEGKGKRAAVQSFYCSCILTYVSSFFLLMTKNYTLALCALGLFLSACGSKTVSTPTPAPTPPVSASSSSAFSVRVASVNNVDKQQFASIANAAPTKKILTKDQFTSEIRAKVLVMMASLPHSSGSKSSKGSSTSLAANFLDARLVNVKTFEKYTDQNGNDIFVALDAQGKVVMEWPQVTGNR